jgi:hypothetical protein
MEVMLVTTKRPADVRLYWRTTDAGTNGPWANTILWAGAANGAWTLGPLTANSTLNPLSMPLPDPSATNQPQRFYQLEAAHP